MRNYLQCSCNLTEEVIDDLHSRSISSVELHLLKDPKISDFYLFHSSGLDCYSVHSPITYENNVGIELNLNDCCIDSVYKSLAKTFLLAQDIAYLKEHKVLVIVHNTASIDMWRRYTQLRNDILVKLRHLSKRCPDVRLVVENVTPLSDTKLFCNGVIPAELVDICNIINEEIGFKLAGICLDLCHYMSSMTFLTDALVHTNKLDYKDNLPQGAFDFSYQLNAISHLLWNVHVASAVGLSDTDETHAYQLTDSDINMLQELNSKWNADERLFTVEVREEDWNVREHAQESLNILRSVLYEGTN